MKIPSDSHITPGIKCQDCRLYVNRVVGVRPTVEEKKLMSIFLSCILCDRLTREKCGDKISPFKCVHCKAVTQDDIYMMIVLKSYSRFLPETWAMCLKSVLLLMTMKYLS